MDLTIVIVTFNSAASLPALAEALPGALAGAAARVVVIDNASADGSANLTRTLWPTATVTVNATNLGFAAAVNQGLTLAVGRAVLLLNPDTEPLPGSIAGLLHHLDAHPAVGIVAPRLLDPRGWPVLSCYPFLTPARVAWRHWQISRLFPDQGLGRYRRAALAPAALAPLVVDWAQGACLLLRRTMLAEVDGLDADFVLYCEEVDLCWRAARRGWATVFLPTVAVRHREGSSSGRVVPLKLASHYYSKALYFAKHHPGAPAVATRVILLLDLALRSVYRALGGLVGHPPDARRRLATYVRVARVLATADAASLVRRWRAEAVAARPD